MANSDLGTIAIGPEFHIDTDLSKEELEPKLIALEPWRIGISFSNGLNTEDFQTMEPFSKIPLNKLRMIAEHCGQDWLHGKRVLDVGSNIGYNSIALANKFGCTVTGLDFNQKNINTAQLIAEMCEADVAFMQGDAGSFVQAETFDLILHLGTLYHLPDPIAALKCSAANLKPGGKLYIESAVYNGKDEYACRYIHGYGGDYTNYWALSPKVVEEILERHGLQNVQKIRDFKIKPYEGTGMSRAFFYAEKP